MWTRGRRTTAGAIAVLAMLLAGCGGGSTSERSVSSPGSDGHTAAGTMSCAAPSACSTSGVEHTGVSTPEPSTANPSTPMSTPPAVPDRGGSSAPPATSPAAGTTTSSLEPVGAADEFCAAVAAINQIPDSDTLSPAESEEALAIIDNLLRLWPAETKTAAQTYFGELRKPIEAGTAVDLDNTSQEFQEAFATVFAYAADACPGGFG